MARGDVISALEHVNAGATYSFIPDAGVSILVTGWALSKRSTVNASLCSGGVSATSFAGDAAGILNTRIFFTHDIYLAIHNGASTSCNVGFTGVQWQ